MKILDQAEIFCTVNRRGAELVSETVFVGRDLEAKATLLVDVGSFLIREACWEISKAPSGMITGCGSTDLILGVEAHIEGKRHMKRLLSLDGGTVLAYLFTDCVKALIQAETFVWRERGFANEEAYDEYWERIEKNGCRAYSHPDPSDLPWMKYAAPIPRLGNLFNRCRHFMLIGLPDGQIEAVGGFHDSFHELGLKMILDGVSGIVASCEIGFAKAPGKACFENVAHAEKFVGKSMLTMTKNEIIDFAGRCEGCYHLVDLFSDVSALISGRSVFLKSMG